MGEPDSSPVVSVIIPVRDGEALIAACLSSIMPQAAAMGARVVVADDHSVDRSAAIAAAAGAEVVTAPRQGGPYHARNIGWRATDAEVIVFTDVRCRARHGWLEALVAAAQSTGAGVTAGVSLVEPGGTWAQRLMHRAQPMDSRRSAAHPFLPWASSANLAVRRKMLESLGGFREGRSGNDIDLCWRAQLEQGERFMLAEDAVMTWEARTSMRACLSQWYRYGRWKPALYRRYESRGARLDPVRRRPVYVCAREIKGLAARLVRRRTFELDIALGFAAIRIVEACGVWVGAQELRRAAKPTRRGFRRREGVAPPPTGQL